MHSHVERERRPPKRLFQFFQIKGLQSIPRGSVSATAPILKQIFEQEGHSFFILISRDLFVFYLWPQNLFDTQANDSALGFN